MSTLTKVLIILMTVTSIFLCGMVVTYVANAENQKEKYENLKTETDSLNQQVKNYKEQIDELEADKDSLEDDLSRARADLQQDVQDLQQKLKDAEREKTRLLERVDAFAAQVESFESTNSKQQKMLQDALAELDTLKEKQLKQEKELKETTAALIEKMALIDTLEKEKRRLVEEKTELEGGMVRSMQPVGEGVVSPQPVTTVDDSIKEAERTMETTEPMSLQGLVTAVDVDNKMASISLGSADGVRVGMKFYVTRGDKFICNILIIDVDTDESVGVMDLVQQMPQKGDTVSSEL